MRIRIRRPALQEALGLTLILILTITHPVLQEALGVDRDRSPEAQVGLDTGDDSGEDPDKGLEDLDGHIYREVDESMNGWMDR